MIYRFDAAKHSLTAATPPSAALKPGAGPRHAAISASGRVVYVIDELDCTITAFRRDSAAGCIRYAVGPGGSFAGCRK